MLAASSVDEWTAAVLDRPLFAPDRKPFARSAVDAGLPRLTGVIASPEDAITIFQPAGGLSRYRCGMVAGLELRIGPPRTQQTGWGRSLPAGPRFLRLVCRKTAGLGAIKHRREHEPFICLSQAHGVAGDHSNRPASNCPLQSVRSCYPRLGRVPRRRPKVSPLENPFLVLRTMQGAGYASALGQAGRRRLKRTASHAPRVNVEEQTLQALPCPDRRSRDTRSAWAPYYLKRPGAGEGNRTLVCSLGSCRSTIELHPRRPALFTSARRDHAIRPQELMLSNYERDTHVAFEARRLPIRLHVAQISQVPWPIVWSGVRQPSNILQPALLQHRSDAIVPLLL
jgi:hypothetical protein